MIDGEDDTEDGCAVGGRFPRLEPTPKPFGIDLLAADQRRCPRCREIRPIAMFQYVNDTHGRITRAGAAVCSECREAAKNPFIEFASDGETG